MRWTNRNRHRVRSVGDFMRRHHRLLCYLLLLWAGITVGLCQDLKMLRMLLPSAFSPLPVIGFSDGLSQIFSSCFLAQCLLMVLFLGGLSACGAPMTALVPVFYGLGLGAIQNLWSAADNVWLSALLLWPHRLPEMAAIILGCCESLRMSLLLAAQLLPGGGMGGLWRDFKWYITRFLVFAVLAFAGGVLDVTGRVLLLSLVGI